MKPNPLITAVGAAIPLATAAGLFALSDTPFAINEEERQKQHDESVRDSLLLAGGSAGLGLVLGGINHPGTIGRGLLYGSAIFFALAFLPPFASTK